MDLVRQINHNQAACSSLSSVDWTAAFKSLEFCTGLQTAVAEAIAKSMGPHSVSSNVAALEQLGEVSPSIPSATSGTKSSRALTEGKVF